MTPQREEEPLEKAPVRFFKSDLDWARRHYRSIGYNKLARILLRRHRVAVERYLRRKAEKRAKEIENGGAKLFDLGVEEPLGVGGDQPNDTE
jgi:hypothetical protein